MFPVEMRMVNKLSAERFLCNRRNFAPNDFHKKNMLISLQLWPPLQIYSIE